MVIRIVQRCSLWRIETFLEWAGAWRRENTWIHKRKFIWKLQKSKTSKGSKFKYKESSKKWIICFFIWRLSECFGLFVWLGSKFITNVPRADLTRDVIKKVAPFVLSKLWILVAHWSMRWSRDTFLIKLRF